jgi:hypothetical protein
MRNAQLQTSPARTLSVSEVIPQRRGTPPTWPDGELYVTTRKVMVEEIVPTAAWSCG